MPVAGAEPEGYLFTMARSDEKSVEARTYSVEEVGAIIRRATAEKASPAAPPLAGHDRVSWPDLVEIASDLDISETALRRAATPEPPAKAKAKSKAEPPPPPKAAEPVDPPAADPLAAEKRRFKHRAAQSALTLAFLGALDLLIGTHGVIFAIGALFLGLRLGRRAIRLWLGPPPHPALADGSHADWRELRRAARHARRAERHAWKSEHHARRAERERYRL